MLCSPKLFRYKLFIELLERTVCHTVPFRNMTRVPCLVLSYNLSTSSTTW